MAKNSVRDFDATAANNTDIQSVDIAENCAPSGINNAIRELMADIKDVSAGTVALESPQADSLTVTGDLTVDTDTLFVDASANAVGIGTDAPVRQLHVNAASGNNAYVHLTNATTGATTTDGFSVIVTDSNGEAILNQREAQPLTFRTQNTERMRIDSSGNVGIGTSPSVKLDIDNGSLKINRGNSSGDIAVFRGLNAEKVKIDTDGIKFNGDTSADNALDDYEIGSWTPAYAVSGGSFSHGLQIGSYVKIGELVTATCRIRGQRSGGSGPVYMSGLPYTSRNISNLHAACSIGFTKSWNTSPKGAFVGTNVTQINFKKAGSTSALSNFSDDLDAADAATAGTSNNDLILSVTYVAN